jgi:hypothetical protein
MDISTILLYITVTMGWLLLLVGLPIIILIMVTSKILPRNYPKDWDLLSGRVFDFSFKTSSPTSIASNYLEMEKFHVLFDDSFININRRFGSLYRVLLKVFKGLLGLLILWMISLVAYGQLSG